tara:strand:+ start:1605 stop:2831 length:1227 start_codon:yes stop_codon:yes gene_type:complete
MESNGMKTLCSALLLLWSSLVWAQGRMSSSDLSFLYDEEHEFLVRHKTVSQGNQFKVYFNFMLNSGNVRISDFQLSYDVRGSYIDEKSVTENTRIDTSQVVDIAFRQYTYELNFEREENDKLLVVDVYNIIKDTHYYIDIPLIEEDTPPPSFLLMEVDKDIPYFARYLNRNRAVRLVNPFGTPLNYEISGIENNKAVAMPPFDETEQPQPSEVLLDTLYGVNEGEVFEFYNEGFYTIRAAQAPNQSLKILVADEFYPYFNDYSELVQPLIYVTTNDEYKALRGPEETRLVFEEFVNNTISANERIAKDFIKFYYRRVRKAARLFTENKAGWKTDRGMVYIIMGDPIQVFRNERTELWVFPDSEGGRIRFIFDIVQEDGITKHKLIRGKRYKENWLLAVSQWRNGRIIE